MRTLEIASHLGIHSKMQRSVKYLVFDRSRGDTFLNSIIEEERGYKYISPTMQNEIICIFDKLILKEIVGKVNAAEGFAVLADETTDIATKEQLTLCVRFIDGNNKVNESFLKFVIIHSLTGTHLASAIINGNDK